MYHQAYFQDCYLETVGAAVFGGVRSGVVILNPYVFARQCIVKVLRSMDLAVDSHEHL